MEKLAQIFSLLYAMWLAWLFVLFTKLKKRNKEKENMMVNFTETKLDDDFLKVLNEVTSKIGKNTPTKERL